MTLAIQAALAIGRKYWGHISAALAVLFLILGIRGYGREAGLRRELAACLAKPPQTITQTITVKEKCKSGGSVTFPPGSPCPDVSWSHETESTASLTQTAQLGGSNGQLGAKNAVFLGAGWGSNGALAVGSVNLGPIQVQGGGGMNAWHAGAAWRVVQW